MGATTMPSESKLNTCCEGSFGLLGREEIIEAAILSDDDDDMLDRGGCGGSHMGDSAAAGKQDREYKSEQPISATWAGVGNLVHVILILTRGG